MKITVLFLLLFYSISIIAQEPAKRVLKINDFTGWNTVSGEIISNNGKYIAYERNPQQGDGILVIQNGNWSDSIARGNNVSFGPENDFTVFHIKPAFATTRKAKLDKVKKEDMPKDSLGIYLFRHNTVAKFPDVKSYKIPEENAGWVAFLTEPAKTAHDTSQIGSDKKNKKEKKQPGDDLTLFKIHSGDTLLIKNVTEYFYSKKGDAVYYVCQKEDSLETWSRIYRFNTGNGQKKQLFETKGWVKKVVSSDNAEYYSFLFSQDTTKEKVYALFLGIGENEPSKIVDEYTQGMPVGWSPSENGDVYFSEDATKLYFGTTESPEPEPKDTIPEDEKPKLDIWNWKDLKLQPQQKIESEKDKKRTYLAVYYIEMNRFIQLADLNIRQVSTIRKGNGDVGLGTDETPYLRSSSWTGVQSRDYYLIDFKSGIKRQMLIDKSFVRLSPQGKFVVWYEPADSSYYAKSTDINNLNIVPLTKVIPVNFFDEFNDQPKDPNPYGIAGWSQDDRFVFIYDRYDVWKIDPSGERVPVCVTKAFGRRNSTRLRYEQLDKELEFIPLNENVLLSAIDERTMSQGYFTAQFSAVKDPSLLIMDRFSFGNIKKAKNADNILWTKQNVKIFPDLWISNLKFENPKKISDANGQQKDFIWSDVELVEWNSFSGEKLKGLLYKPENLDPNIKYPMIVYYYERNSESLHQHQIPSPSRSTINKTFYTSNGYLVFIPDITYREGYPGQSAYNSIVSGTQYLINKFSFVDKDHIGLQGQSWGGYQTAYLITQTDMFAAAMAGAPVSNMTSAYGGIRWETGLSRMFQYEHTQSRIGGTLWDKPLNYIENSPLFYAPKINTPLLMMHNDADGAVPWYQGIEFFVALRRLNKPVWMLSYNDEPHNLKATSWANRVDLSTRMFQFFNHYLKGKPIPEWMEKGVPAIEKGKQLGY